MNFKLELIRESIKVLFIKTIGTGLAFILSIVLARTLGADGFGIYSFVLSILIFFSIPLQAGLPNLVVRETAKAHHRNDWLSIKGLLRWIFKLLVIYIMGLFLVLSILYLLDLNWIDKEREEVFFAGILLVPFIPILLIQNATIRGLRRVVIGIIPDSILRPGLALVLISLSLLFYNESFTPVSAMLLYTCSILIAFVISLIIMWKLTPKENRNLTVFHTEMQEWKKAAYPLTIVGGLQLMYSYIDIIILGFFHSNEDVGVYRAVGQLGTLVVFGLTAINQMLHSHFAKLYASNELDNLQKIVTYSSFAIFAVAAIPSIIFIFFGEFVLGTIFGEEFIIGVLPLVILTIGQLANATFGSVGALLNMTGHEKDAMKGMFYSLGVNLLLGFILIPTFGMIGAATATAISLIVWNAILRYYVKKRLNIESIGFIQILKQRNLK
jgi:O-antigen/teichoic acid export membrane protein